MKNEYVKFGSMLTKIESSKADILLENIHIEHLKDLGKISLNRYNEIRQNNAHSMTIIEQIRLSILN